MDSSSTPPAPCCAVGRREDAAEIDAALRAGGQENSVRKVAERFGLGRTAVSEHRRCLGLRSSADAPPDTSADKQRKPADASGQVAGQSTAKPGQQKQAQRTGTDSHRPVGRPTVLTPELREAIAKSIRGGCPTDDAAAMNGVDPATLYRWMERGRAGEPEFREFCESVTRARAAAKRRAIREVRQGVLVSGAKDWKAWAWWLERMYPNEFGPQANVHVKVEKELSAALDRLKERLDPAVYVMVLGALAEEAGGEPARRSEEGSRASQVN
jgi:transposase-like protein